MKFNQPTACHCGGTFPFSTYGDAPWKPVLCSQCGTTAHQINPLSVSVTAERLLNRSKAELESGDYSLSIVIGTMAIESYLTRLFFKIKGMDSFATTFTWPTEAQEKAWENDYPKKGGFTGPADFISKATTGLSFDEFVASNPTATAILATFTDASNRTPKQYVQSELFHLRNRIAHWGYVDTTKAEAEKCHRLAVAVVSTFREMDRMKYGNL